MTYDEAMERAKANPGLGVREKRMQAKWKIVWLNLKAGDGDFFCINPITGSNYQYRPSDADKASTKWGIT